MCYIPIIELKFLDIQFFFIYIPNIQGIYKIYSHFCFSLFYLSKSKLKIIKNMNYVFDHFEGLHNLLKRVVPRNN